MERIAEFTHRAEAELARASLEADGIPALLVGDDAGGVYPGALPVYLLVDPGDRDRAREVLEPMHPSEGPLTDSIPGWAILGLILAVLIALGMLVLTLTH
ncbi:MAG: DUF2007 domain-containing protein [Acidimicrobiia bacterium]